MMAPMPKRPAPDARLAIRGDPARFKLFLREKLKAGDDLLDQVDGARARMKASRAGKKPGTFEFDLDSFLLADEWGKRLDSWSRSVARNLVQHLPEDAERAAPAFFPASRPKEPSLDHHEGRMRGEVADLRALVDRLGTRRDVQRVAPSGIRLDELRASGLVDDRVIEAAARKMERTATVQQRRDCIGAAKEIAEATLRGALDRLDVSWRRRDDLPMLMKTWRTAVKDVAPPGPAARESFDKVQMTLSNLLTFLAETRNEYGSGHAQPSYPAGLRIRHARLAVDAAETVVRFVAATIDEMERLPPE